MKKVFPKIQTFTNLIRSGISVSTKQTENVKFIEKLVNTSFVRTGCNKYVYHLLRFLSRLGSEAWCDIEDDPRLKISTITYEIIINDLGFNLKRLWSEYLCTCLLNHWNQQGICNKIANKKFLMRWNCVWDKV